MQWTKRDEVEAKEGGCLGAPGDEDGGEDSRGSSGCSTSCSQGEGGGGGGGLIGPHQ